MDMGKILSQRGAKLYFIGIKGTGMCALAELLHNSGLDISGSDKNEVFYTDGILKELDIPYHESFDPAHVPGDADLIVHSAAYSAENNPEMERALELGKPLFKYTDVLGAYSSLFYSSGIAGVHGKTTTAALTGIICEAAGLPARILAGSAVSAFAPPGKTAGRSTLILGDTYFAAETCEYRRHFLAFHPKVIVLTSVESDHQDYFPAYEDIREAFVEYIQKLPADGLLIYCADDRGACDTAQIIREKMPELAMLPYGFTANEDEGVHVKNYRVENERSCFSLSGFSGELKLRAPGRHLVLDAAAALVLCGELVKKEFGGWDQARQDRVRKALEAFSGSRRRSEILGEAGGILFMDDYGHHPTAVKATLKGLKEFYPGRRLVVSFMSHTYTRTAALLEDFAASLLPADLVMLHKIYGSAREVYHGGVNGKTLYERCVSLSGGVERVRYVEEPEDASAELEELLKPGDLFITMGAGDNWKLGRKLFDHYRGAAP
jgi:UDP-N-acetylmuramate--alanine ligase